MKGRLRAHANNSKGMGPLWRRANGNTYTSSQLTCKQCVTASVAGNTQNPTSRTKHELLLFLKFARSNTSKRSRCVVSVRPRPRARTPRSVSRRVGRGGPRGRRDGYAPHSIWVVPCGRGRCGHVLCPPPPRRRKEGLSLSAPQSPELCRTNFRTPARRIQPDADIEPKLGLDWPNLAEFSDRRAEFGPKSFYGEQGSTTGGGNSEPVSRWQDDCWE